MRGMSEPVTDSYGRRIVPPRELPPGAIGWNIYESVSPTPLGVEPEWRFVGFAADEEAVTRCGAEMADDAEAFAHGEGDG